MVRDKKFRDEFWDCDYIGSQGFDVLVRKLKDGYKMCKEVEEFFKQRAKYEEEYAKNLQKLAKNSSSLPETGTLRYAWDEMKMQMEHISQQHFDAARQYNEEASRVMQYADQQRNARKSSEAVVSNCIKNKKLLYNKCLDAKRTYDAKCKESESQDGTVNNMKATNQNAMVKPQEWDKIITKQTKAGNDARHAEKAYIELLASLEDARLHWQKEMVNLCDAYERFEENRILFLRNELWVATNVCSQTCVEEDNHAEAMRVCLEKCDADADILDFVSKNRVGQKCPSKVEFQPYLSQVSSKPWSPEKHTGQHGQQVTMSGGGRPPQPLPSRPPPSRPPAGYRQNLQQ